MTKKSLGEKFDVVGNRLNTLYGLLVGIGATVAYFYWFVNPSLVATGERFHIELPEYEYQEPMTAEERKQKGFDWKNDSFFDGPQYRESWHIIVENKGKATLKELKVEMPVDGYYKLGEGELKTFAKEIPLGSLTGYNKLKVEVWTTHYVIDSPKDYRVSHEEGSEEIAFPPVLTATDYWILYIDKAVLVMIILAGWCMIIYRKARANASIHRDTTKRQQAILGTHETTKQALTATKPTET